MKLSTTEAIVMSLFGLAVILAIIAGRPTSARSSTDVKLSEHDWCERLADKYGAETEVMLWDRSRCDLVTETEAIEVDRAKKWAEAIGQGQYYGLVLRKQPAVLLLVEDGEERFVWRCQAVCAKLGMPLYVERIDR